MLLHAALLGYSKLTDQSRLNYLPEILVNLMLMFTKSETFLQKLKFFASLYLIICLIKTQQRHRRVVEAVYGLKFVKNMHPRHIFPLNSMRIFVFFHEDINNFPLAKK